MKINSIRNLSALGATSLLLFGCNNPVEPVGTIGNIINPKAASSVFLTLNVFEGRKLLAVKSDISHIQLLLFKIENNIATPITLGGGEQVSLDVNYGGIEAPIKLTKLKAETAYRIQAVAYGSPGFDSNMVISTGDSACITDFSIGTDTSPVVVPIKVKLIDGPFSGQGSSNLVITEGQ